MSYWRRVALTLCLALLVGCSAKPPKPLWPGSVQSVHFAKTGAARFRMLAKAVVPLDAKRARVAENASELKQLWDEYEIESARPAVDFGSELVVTFTDGSSFCNDGVLEGFSLSSAGELIPLVRRSPRACNFNGTYCPKLLAYVVALPRVYFPEGGYVLRHGANEHTAFAIRGGSGPVEKPRARGEVLVAPARSGNGVGPSHARRARVIYANGREAVGVWVRDDAVWLPLGRPEAPELEQWVDAPLDLACDDSGCVRALASDWCVAPECPADGVLVLCERPLRARGPWPSEAAAWESLMRELFLDPMLAEGLGSPPHFPVAKPEPVPRIGWAAAPFHRWGLELAASAEAAWFTRDRAEFAGAALRLGLRTNYSIQDTTSAGLIREPVAGDSWGLDLRVRALGEVEGAGAARALFAAGIALAADNALGRSSSEARARLPSLLGIVLPEFGVIGRAGAPIRLYTAHSLPIWWLFARGFALEVRPALGFRLAPSSAGGPAPWLSLSIGLMGRAARSSCE
jgi:hypothetical protein